jgi:hypothetical protein
MRMGRWWAARDVTLVMMHGSTVGVDLEDGRTRRETSFDFLLGEKRHRINSRSCFDPQFVGIIALPLSGFVMDIGDGFVKTKQNPQVNGFEYDNFNVRNTGDVWIWSGVTWEYNLGANVPEIGVIYTPSGVDRSDSRFPFLRKKIVSNWWCSLSNISCASSGSPNHR